VGIEKIASGLGAGKGNCFLMGFAAARLAGVLGSMRSKNQQGWMFACLHETVAGVTCVHGTFKRKAKGMGNQWPHASIFPVCGFMSDQWWTRGFLGMMEGKWELKCMYRDFNSFDFREATEWLDAPMPTEKILYNSRILSMLAGDTQDIAEAGGSNSTRHLMVQTSMLTGAKPGWQNEMGSHRGSALAAQGLVPEEAAAWKDARRKSEMPNIYARDARVLRHAYIRACEMSAIRRYIQETGYSNLPRKNPWMHYMAKAPRNVEAPPAPPPPERHRELTLEEMAALDLSDDVEDDV